MRKNLNSFLDKRIDQYKKDVQFRRTTSSAIVRHVDQFEHEIDWGSVECIEKSKKRLFPRKHLGSTHIRANKKICMNLNAVME